MVDDWLIEDVLPRKRQRTDIAAVFSGLDVRRRDPTQKRPRHAPCDLDSDDAIYSRSPTPPTAEDASDYNHVSQIESNTRSSANTSRKPAKKQSRIDTFARPSLDRPMLPSSVGSSQQPVSNASRDVTGHRMTAAVIMRLRVNIQGKVILVPLPPRYVYLVLIFSGFPQSWKSMEKNLVMEIEHGLSLLLITNHAREILIIPYLLAYCSIPAYHSGFFGIITEKRIKLRYYGEG